MLVPQANRRAGLLLGWRRRRMISLLSHHSHPAIHESVPLVPSPPGVLHAADVVTKTQPWAEAN